jgi:hypothetical protein
MAKPSVIDRNSDMAKRLQVPPELESLIEKREQEQDRRQAEQRSGRDKRKVDLGPLGALETAKDIDEVPAEDRRKSGERRKHASRRKKPRRKED